MSLATLGRTAVMTILIVSLSGCSYFRGADADDDAEVTDINETKTIEPDELLANLAKEVPPAVGELELKLKVGDRFPLSKSVEQRLTQADKEGVTVSTSRTDMMLSLVVDKVHADGSKQLTVRYHRVQHEEDIRGKRISYSSERPSEPVAPEALLYAGLADNGFSFVLGPNNKVEELIGFNDFLRRCLRNVPAQFVDSVQQQLESMKSGDGIANFVDDSIGILPYSNDPRHPAVAVKEGTAWDLDPRRSDTPIPILVTTRCVLKELSANSAEILLSGSISGKPNGVTVRTSNGDMKIVIRNGHSTGSCRVDRKTGLPTQSQVQRSLELAMECSDGQKIEQRKETFSTIKSFLDQQSASTTDQNIQQTNFQQAFGAENHRRVTQAIDPAQPVHARQ